MTEHTSNESSQPSPGEGLSEDQAEAREAHKNAEAEGGSTSVPDDEPKKPTTLKLSSALIPVLVTIGIGTFIVYPYIKELRESGPQSIFQGKSTEDLPHRASQGRPSVTPEFSFSTDAERLLKGIEKGGELGGFSVTDLKGPLRQRIEISVKKDAAQFKVMVSRLDMPDFPPLKTTQMYAIYYQKAEGGVEVSSEQYLAVVEAVASVVEKNERQVSMPDGL